MVSDGQLETFFIKWWGLLNRKRWITALELSTAAADYVENFYYLARRHCSLNCLTPDEFENRNFTQTRTTFS